MTYRAYPNAARARAQLDRHVHPVEDQVVTMRPETAALMQNLMRAGRNLALTQMTNAAVALRALPTSTAFFPAARPEGSSG